MSKAAKYRIVLLRHGESTWNKENRFTGWTDVPLTEKGHSEARSAGKLLHDAGMTFDVAYTSVLRRAIQTLWNVLNELELHWIPVTRDYRLNERHYGGLQGLNKAETAAEHGEAQVKIWRRSYATPPPALEVTDERHPSHDARYAGVPADALPATESLALTVDRVVPYWDETLAPAIRSGKQLLIVAHGNSLRALVKHLDGISDDEIVGVNIPTGVPLVYELDEDLKPVHQGEAAATPLSGRYLGDADEIAARAAAVAAQGSAAAGGGASA